MRKAIAYITVIAVCAWVIFTVGQNPQWLAALKRLSVSHIAGLLVFAFLYIFFQGLILREALVPFGVRLVTKEWFGLMVVTLLGNYVVPMGGLGFRATYLKREHNLGYANFVVCLASICFIELVVFTAGGLLSLALLPAASSAPLWLACILGAGLAGLLTVAWFPSLPGALGFLRWEKTRNAWEGWLKFRAHRSAVRAVAFYTTLVFLSYGAIFSVAYAAAGLTVPPSGAFLVGALSDYAFFIRLAPAALGTFEASVLLGSSLFHVTPAQAVAVVGLSRLTLMAWYFTLGPLLLLGLMATKDKNVCIATSVSP